MKKLTICAIISILALPAIARAAEQPAGNGLSAGENTLYAALKQKAESPGAATNNPTEYYVYSKAKGKSDCNGEPSEGNTNCWKAVLTAYEKSLKTVVDPSKVNNQLDKIKDKDNNELIDNNTRKGTVNGTPDDKNKNRDPNKDKKDKKKEVLTTDDSTTAAAKVPTGPGPGPLTAAPAPAKEDPNKWNNTIAGIKGAIVWGVVGLILGGPMGMFLCAAVGFGAGYLINKMS